MHKTLDKEEKCGYTLSNFYSQKSIIYSILIISKENICQILFYRIYLKDKKVGIAFSGGLDTSAALLWMRQKAQCLMPTPLI